MTRQLAMSPTSPQQVANSLSTLETIVADFGNNLSPKTATVAKTGYSRRIRRLSPPNSATGDSRRFWRQSPNFRRISACGQGFTSRCNGIWETTRHNEPTYYGFATEKLRGNWCNVFWDFGECEQWLLQQQLMMMMMMMLMLCDTGLSRGRTATGSGV